MKRFSFVVAPLVVLGCGLFTGPEGDLDLSIQVNSPVVYADSGLTITVVAINPTDDVIRITTRCGGRNALLGVELFAPTDTMLWGPDELNCGFDDGNVRETVLEIAPGDSIVQTHEVRPGRFLSTSTASAGQHIYRWPAGTYRATGLTFRPDGSVGRRTDTIEFTLVCSDPSWTEC